MDRSDAPTPQRRLGGALEPVIGQVYFAPECHEGYAALGFEASSADMDGVALPDGPAYFTSRGSLMGQVRGQVVASAFAVFNPAVVVPSVDHGWSLTDAPTICAARDNGALAQLGRLLGADIAHRERVEALLVRATDGLDVAGRPLAAGICGLEDPDHPFGTIFRRGDLLREYRGDAHTAAWVHAGLSAVEIGLLTEPYWGLPLRSYTRTRGWTDDDFDAAEDRMRTAGLLDDAGFTPAGRELRERIEIETDRLSDAPTRSLGDDLDELVQHLSGWSAVVRAGRGYPTSGPQELADRAAGR